MSTLKDRLNRWVSAVSGNRYLESHRFPLTCEEARLVAAALERQGEEPQFDKNRGYTQPQVNEGFCDACDMRWTGYGTQCPVCEGER